MDRVIDALSRSHARALALLFVLSLAFFLPGQFTLQPMDRDEPRFAQASKQMLETGDFVDIRFQDEARHKKPVGIYWLQSAAVAGAARLGLPDALTTIGYYRIPSLIGAVLAVWLTYWAALAFLSRPGALLAAGLMAGCILLGVEARLAKTDAVLTATVIAAMGALARVYAAHCRPGADNQPGLGNALVFWVAVGIGILIKGPITPLIPLIVVVVLGVREWGLGWLRPLRPGLGLLIVAAIALPWLVAIYLKSGGAFFTESVGKDMMGKVGGVAEKHWGPPGAYFFSFWATFWPAAPLVVLSSWFAWRERGSDAVAFLLAWCLPMWVVLEFLPTKLPHYILPLMPAIAILTVLAGERGILPGEGWRTRTGAALMLLIPLGLMIGTPMAYWKLDGALPLAAMPLLGLAAVIAAFGARALLRADLKAATVYGLLAALPLSVAAFRFGMPELQAINLSKRLVAMAQGERCQRPAYATSGYREPSLVFLTSTQLAMLSGIEVPGFLYATGGDCRIAFVEAREEAEFRRMTAPNQSDHRLVGRVKGININGGRMLDIGVWIKR